MIAWLPSLMDSIDLTFHEACVAHQKGQMSLAEGACRSLLQSNPHHVPGLILLGATLHETQRYAEAAQNLELAVRLEPQSVGALSRLGSTFFALRNYARSAECYLKCVELAPQNPSAYYQLGNALYALKESEKAAAQFGRAIILEPHNYKYWSNLGNCLRDMNHLKDSLAAYHRALEIEPHNALIHWNRSLVLLAAGELKEGFQEYEWRLGPLQCREYPKPLWKGEPIPGKTLLLLAEQGMGDMILFSRYAPLARSLAGRVILECHAPLKPLFAESNLADEITVLDDPLPPFDYYIPLLSLPSLLLPGSDEMIGIRSYLSVITSTEIPGAPAQNVKAGLVWSGNPLHDDNERRSISLNDLSPLINLPGVTFYSLQLLVPPDDEAPLKSTPNLVDMRGVLKNMRDTASIIKQMDIVVTVDTSVANLAGALGKPVFVLLQYAPDWRWRITGTQTPWYPTARLFRQQNRDEWAPVIQSARLEMQHFQKSSHPASAPISS